MADGAAPPGDQARQLIAWLLWCMQQGYTDASDRAILTNWIGDDQATLIPDDIRTREHLLTMADEVLAAAAPAIRDAERQRIRDLAVECQAVYRVVSTYTGPTLPGEPRTHIEYEQFAGLLEADGE